MDALSSLATDRDSFVAQRSKPDREIRKDVRCKVRPVVIALTERKWEGRTQSRGLDEQRFGVEQLDEAEHLATEVLVLPFRVQADRRNQRWLICLLRPLSRE
jgi:hypothetical protein